MRYGKRPLVVGAIAASATAAAAFAVAAGSASGIDTPQTMDLKVGRGHDTAVDVGKHGDSIGDGFITTGARLTDTSGKVAGSADVLGTILSRGEDAVQISLRLSGGRDACKRVSLAIGVDRRRELLYCQTGWDTVKVTLTL